ncbi:MAG TPA: hypothetical protein VK166_08215 [Chitinophagaceae bacterium]|nr:hypothetical protein [Chitinophagaceae bacterium]
MKVHLIKSREVDPELFTQVVDLLGAVPGPLRFHYSKTHIVDFGQDEVFNKRIPSRRSFEQLEDVMANYSLSAPREFPMERQTVSWDTLFSKTEKYRLSHKIPENEFVILLTDIPNKSNWFACLDEKMPFNGFVHTADWDYFIDCPPAFPIAFEVMALVLQKHMFQGKQDLRESVHQPPIGCINDLCLQKQEIILKLRTADICKDCMNLLKPHMPMLMIRQALNILESLRLKMLYAQNFKQESPLSKLVINKYKPFLLPDFGNIEIRLRPLEKAIFLLFLEHPEGIFLSSLADHRQELYDIYAAIANNGTVEEMRSRVEDLTNALSNSASEKISRIKRCFEEAIGEELAAHYYIQGAHGEAKFIKLDRALVEFGP